MAVSNLKNNISIIESGTEAVSGVNWTYRKWSDGTAECWGTKSYSLAITNVYGYAYYSIEVNVSFPTGLFTAIPHIEATSQDTSGYGTWINITTNGTSKDKVRFLMYSASSITTGGKVEFYAIGTWR